MAAHQTVELIANGHHRKQQKQMAQHPQQRIAHPNHASHQNADENHHKQEAGTTAWVKSGAGPDIFYRQRLSQLVAFDGLVLCTVVGKDPPHILEL